MFGCALWLELLETFSCVYKAICVSSKGQFDGGPCRILKISLPRPASYNNNILCYMQVMWCWAKMVLLLYACMYSGVHWLVENPVQSLVIGLVVFSIYALICGKTLKPHHNSSAHSDLSPPTIPTTYCSATNVGDQDFLGYVWSQHMETSSAFII